MVAGKRYAEIRLAERTGAKIRRSLESYSPTYLRFVWTLSATVLIMTYGLWAFEIRELNHHSMWTVLSIVPFVIAVLRYAVDVDSGNGGEPEEHRPRGPSAAGALPAVGAHTRPGRLHLTRPPSAAPTCGG